MPSQRQHRAYLHARTIDVLCIDDGDERGVGRVAQGAPWTGPCKAGRRVLDHVRTLDPCGQEALHLRRAAGNTACVGGDLADGTHSLLNTYLQLRCPRHTRKPQVHSHVSEHDVPRHGSHMGASWVDSQASCTLAPRLTVSQSYPNLDISCTCGAARKQGGVQGVPLAACMVC